ncbi:MAG: patatin-like phospholipase family protein [Sideroxydans sp.]|nr:patatin-like phospholipase family protein [Sideroxydans sp.]NOT98614.1 patatin-like phospholipase family protein [Sideroxydans sp.]
MKRQKIGLILTGGGARAAYQVGVLKAIAEFMPYRSHMPFDVVCGTSAGALNAVTLAVNARHFRKGVRFMLSIWSNARVSDIYRSDALGVLSNSARWIAGLLLSVLGSRRLDQVSLLDNRPMRTFLERTLPCELIQAAIDDGLLHALSVTASGYGSGHSVTFYQGAASIEPWKRARRVGLPTQISIQHMLASSAIPFLFPAVHVNREYFGDGSMRQIAPISSALHMGAERVLVVGVGHGASEQDDKRAKIDGYPALAEIAGHALDSIFIDGLEVDLERLHRINATISMMPPDVKGKIKLQHIEALVITPSQPLERIAERHAANLPWPIRLLLRLVGVMRGSGANLVSYLLFEKHYCRALIDLGYQDAFKRRAEILEFFEQGGSPTCNDMPQ